ncbi:MAG TPA: alternative ribosome rescue aminoacyl-tRNA hydrolase ArfB [Candidatus Aminicenantes bacterium]|nr:alternative ribosome rescue aminoacyl-tRNA hydrolase ArfB [Candidatus Aminicenantes bacterium]
MAIRVDDTLGLDDREITWEFVRSSGPGGQNVNKVATAVKLYFAIGGSPSLPEAVKARLRSLAGRRVNADDVLVIDARRFRTQEANRRDALERLLVLIRRATVVPVVRRATRPGAAAIARRVAAKRRRAQTKSDRRPVNESDD